MGEVKLHAHLLCRTSGCQEKKSYILGNSEFFASPGARVPSNNHTKIDSLLIRKRVRKGVFRGFPQPHHSLPLVEDPPLAWTGEGQGGGD